MSEEESSYEDYLFEKDQEQFETVMELQEGMETMDDDEFDRKYDSLDPEYKELVDDSISDFANGAIGDEHWDSDN